MNKLKFIITVVVILAFVTLPAFAGTPETAALYKAKCAACHGPDGTGSAIGKKIGARDFSSPDVLKLTDAQLLDSVTKGKNKMPAFKDKLKESEIKDLVAFVKEMAKKK